MGRQSAHPMYIVCQTHPQDVAMTAEQFDTKKYPMFYLIGEKLSHLMQLYVQ